MVEYNWIKFSEVKNLIKRENFCEFLVEYLKGKIEEENNEELFEFFYENIIIKDVLL